MPFWVSACDCTQVGKVELLFFAGGGVGQQRFARELALRMLFDSRYIANLPARVTFDLQVDAGDLRNEMAFINDNRGTHRQANARVSADKALLGGLLCVQTLWRVKQVPTRVACLQKPSHLFVSSRSPVGPLLAATPPGCRPRHSEGSRS